jgi:hypothetical protein
MFLLLLLLVFDLFCFCFVNIFLSNQMLNLFKYLSFFLMFSMWFWCHQPDMAIHFLMRAGITCLRRVRKTDNNRIARAVGGTIVFRPEELRESDVGTGCGLFEVQKIGDEYFCYLVECKEPKAVTVLLRGGSKGACCAHHPATSTYISHIQHILPHLNECSL